MVQRIISAMMINEFIEMAKEVDEIEPDFFTEDEKEAEEGED